MSEVTLIIPIHSKEQLERVFNAERELSEAGVTFDSGSLLTDGEIKTREWYLDWSLKGAELRGKMQ